MKLRQIFTALIFIFLFKLKFVDLLIDKDIFSKISDLLDSNFCNQLLKLNKQIRNQIKNKLQLDNICLKHKLENNKILSVSFDNTIRIWDLDSGICTQTLKGQSRQVTSAKFCQVTDITNGFSNLNITSIGHDMISIWDAISGSLKNNLKDGQLLNYDDILQADISQDGKNIVTINYSKTIRVQDIFNKKMIAEIINEENDFYNNAFLSQDNKQIVTSSRKKLVGIQEIESGKVVFNIKQNHITIQVTLNSDNLLLLTCCLDGIARVQNLESNSLEIEFYHDNVVNYGSFNSDSSKIVTLSYDNIARLWDRLSGDMLQCFKGHSKLINSAVFSPDNSMVITASLDETIKIWDLGVGECIQTLMGHGDQVWQAEFSPCFRR